MALLGLILVVAACSSSPGWGPAIAHANAHYADDAGAFERAHVNDVEFNGADCDHDDG
jgi:hypothetical protein